MGGSLYLSNIFIETLSFSNYQQQYSNAAGGYPQTSTTTNTALGYSGYGQLSLSLYILITWFAF